MLNSKIVLCVRDLQSHCERRTATSSSIVASKAKQSYQIILRGFDKSNPYNEVAMLSSVARHDIFNEGIYRKIIEIIEN